jgi:hypothetical protein
VTERIGSEVILVLTDWIIQIDTAMILSMHGSLGLAGTMAGIRIL